MLYLIATLVGTLFNIGLSFVLLHFIFKDNLSLKIKILIAALISIIFSHLLRKSSLIELVIEHIIATPIFYLFLKSGLLKLKKSNNSANKEKEIKNKTGRNSEW